MFRNRKTFTVALIWAVVLIAIHPSQVNAENAAALSSDRASLEKVEEVLAGNRNDANAAWWGFNPEDATDSIQSAFDSGAKKVIIPYMGKPWIVRPLQLRGNQEVHFEPGVVLLAKRGEYLGRGDSLFTANGAENLSMHGYGATLRMRKTDYMAPPYEKAEWRMGLSLRGCKGVLVEGLRIESSGGDGIYIDGGANRRYCEDVTIRDVTCFDNHRQGMSVISAKGLLVERSVFANTWGTAPGAGIDLEPDGEEQSLVEILIRDCLFENNEGHEILVYPKNLHEKAPNISIRFENCIARKTLTDGKPDGVAQGIGRNDQGHGWSGISVAAVCDDGPSGLIEFVDCLVENTGKESVRVFDKSASKAELRFANCHFRNPWLTAHPDHWQSRVPIHFQVRRPHVSRDLGGIVFENCYVYDSKARPVMVLELENSELGLRNVKGQITVAGPGEPRVVLGTNVQEVDLQLLDAREPLELERQPDADAE
ncbi:MAG: right-handed parallel beta-helix repeat-containing protein [Planctomycetales bacterium]|nr:right-handed parallel beta-helix repeat-containing protein [Planctomycetales bacterium]